eukprot:gene32488-42092_t
MMLLLRIFSTITHLCLLYRSTGGLTCSCNSKATMTIGCTDMTFTGTSIADSDFYNSPATIVFTTVTITS